MLREIYQQVSWPMLISMENLLQAYKLSSKGKIKYKYKTTKISYQTNKILTKIQQALFTHTYKFSSYHNFHLQDTKTREIWVPTFQDKIVQMALTNVITPFLTQLAITDTYACVKGRGTHAAVKTIYNYQYRAKREYGKDGVFLKADVSKFFFSIDREILKSLLKKDILCPNTYELLCMCIDSFQVTQVGLPLGNVISQHLANYYLNTLDHKLKRDYKVKYYVRYADDMFLYLPNKEYAKEVRDFIVDHCRDYLHLTINPVKTYIVPINITEGLGYKIHLDHISLLAKDKRRFKQLVIKGNINSLNSWYGCKNLAKCHSFIHSVLQDTYITFDGRRFYDLLKVNKENFYGKFIGHFKEDGPDKLSPIGGYV